jgi:hypothetical protein
VDVALSGLLGELVQPRRAHRADGVRVAVKAVIDWANLVVLACADLYAFVRRFIRPAFVPMSLDAMLILGAIMLLVLSHFGMHACEIAVAGAYIPGNPVSGQIGAMARALRAGPEVRAARESAHRTYQL